MRTSGCWRARIEGCVGCPPSRADRRSAVLKFPVIFWVLTLSCVCVYIDICAWAVLGRR